MKNRICKFIYEMLYKIDKVEPYSYETAPYCGNHFSGHKGKLTLSSYHEGDGVCEARLFGVRIRKYTYEKNWRVKIK